MSLGVGATFEPAAWSAAIFSAAVPLPPEMIAPAWPMRLPGGAATPAMNEATGFFMCFLIHSAARISALLEELFSWSVDDEEMLYLSLHVARLTASSD